MHGRKNIKLQYGVYVTSRFTNYFARLSVGLTCTCSRAEIECLLYQYFYRTRYKVKLSSEVRFRRLKVMFTKLRKMAD